METSAAEEAVSDEPRFPPAGSWLPNPDGGALLLHHPRSQPPELVKVDPDGREVGRVLVPYGDLESGPTFFDLPGGPQALAALDSGEVVIGSTGGGFEVVDPTTGAVLLERPTSQLISSDGRSVYWLGDAEPRRGGRHGKEADDAGGAKSSGPFAQFGVWCDRWKSAA